jgi:hypothetical protein
LGNNLGIRIHREGIIPDDPACFMITKLDRTVEYIALVLSHQKHWVIGMITSPLIMPVDSKNNTNEGHEPQNYDIVIPFSSLEHGSWNFKFYHGR